MHKLLKRSNGFCTGDSVFKWMSSAKFKKISFVRTVFSIARSIPKVRRGGLPQTLAASPFLFTEGTSTARCFELTEEIKLLSVRLSLQLEKFHGDRCAE